MVMGCGADLQHYCARKYRVYARETISHTRKGIEVTHGLCVWDQDHFLVRRKLSYALVRTSPGKDSKIVCTRKFSFAPKRLDSVVRPCKSRQYCVGQMVWRYYPPWANEKLNSAWTGPWIVERQYPNATVQVQLAKGGVGAKEDATLMVHASCLETAGTTAEGKLLQYDQYRVLQYPVPGANTKEKHNEEPERSLPEDHDWGPGELASGSQDDLPISR